MGPVAGGGAYPAAALNAEREVHAVPTGSPDGAVWSGPAVITCAGRQSATICARRRSGSVIASGTNVTPPTDSPVPPPRSPQNCRSAGRPDPRARRLSEASRRPLSQLRRANSPRVNARSRSLIAGRSGARSAWSSTAPSTPWSVTPSRRCCTRAILAHTSSGTPAGATASDGGKWDMSSNDWLERHVGGATIPAWRSFSRWLP